MRRLDCEEARVGEYGTEFQNQPVDVSGEFADQENHFFVGSKVSEVDTRGLRQDSVEGRVPHAARLLPPAHPPARGLQFCLPENGELCRLYLEREGDGFALREDPAQGEVEWNVRTFGEGSARDA